MESPGLAIRVTIIEIPRRLEHKSITRAGGSLPTAGAEPREVNNASPSDQGVLAVLLAWLLLGQALGYRQRMGRIVYETATSIDGYLADEQHSLDWLFAVPGGDQPELAPPDAAVQVMGSTTYEWVLRELGALENMNVWGHEMSPTVVVFTTRQLVAPSEADVRFVSGEVADVVPMLRDIADDGVIWVVGGGDLASQFIAARALDEIGLSVAPAALGGGAPLLSTRIESDQLHLTDVQQVGQFARLTYQLSYPDEV